MLQVLSCDSHHSSLTVEETVEGSSVVWPAVRIRRHEYRLKKDSNVFIIL